MALDDKTLDSITEIGTGGKRRLIPIKVVRWLQNDNHQEFITLQKSGILRRYNPDSGAWTDDAEEWIKTMMQQELGDFISKNTVGEVCNYCYDLSFYRRIFCFLHGLKLFFNHISNPFFGKLSIPSSMHTRICPCVLLHHSNINIERRSASRAI